MSRTAVVAGVGPGLGESLVRKFAAEGCAVAFLARSVDYLDSLESDLQAEGHDALGIEADVGDREDVADAFAAVRSAFGDVDVLVCHASGGGWNGLAETTPDSFEDAWRTAAYGGFLCAKEVAPAMRENGSGDGDGSGDETDDGSGDETGDSGGTIIFTGATSAIRGRAGSLGFSSAKFAVRGMAQSLAQELGSDGVHVAHVVVDGQILPPDGPAADRREETYLDPDELAETYWRLVEQPTDTMSFEVHATNGNGEIEFV